MSEIILSGKAHKYGSNVNTDEIIPARYLNTSDPDELAKHCMEDIDTEFVKKAKPGDFIVAESNFGCGSSREHAPIAIKAAGLQRIDHISLTTRKPIYGFADNAYVQERRINLSAIKKETVLFEGNVHEAVKYFTPRLERNAAV